jgi:hypothetical protein
VELYIFTALALIVGLAPEFSGAILQSWARKCFFPNLIPLKYECTNQECLEEDQQCVASAAEKKFPSHSRDVCYSEWFPAYVGREKREREKL